MGLAKGWKDVSYAALSKRLAMQHWAFKVEYQSVRCLSANKSILFSWLPGFPLRIFFISVVRGGAGQDGDRYPIHFPSKKGRFLPVPFLARLNSTISLSRVHDSSICCVGDEDGWSGQGGDDAQGSFAKKMPVLNTTYSTYIYIYTLVVHQLPAASMRNNTYSSGLSQHTLEGSCKIHYRLLPSLGFALEAKDEVQRHAWVLC